MRWILLPVAATALTLAAPDGPAAAAAGSAVSTAPVSARNPLIEAAKRGDLAAARASLASPAGAAALAESDGLGRTALHYAARLGHADLVEALLAAGAAVDARDASGYTPLLRAVQGGDANADVVAILLQAGADPEARGDGDDALALAGAVGAGRLQALLRQAAGN